MIRGRSSFEMFPLELIVDSGVTYPHCCDVDDYNAKREVERGG